ncbi:cytochrome P450 [Amycolatopsis sp. RTGN1]|uniref:cytochrome P450 n=1 Tax=Amycolatopsis ponsaeliensis TaxID=2992142 RepID=UPI00254BC163|nr:cytochrome P450 [Amycolatopsis sp. RTGN1]
MAETETTATRIPEYPGVRDGECPFAPPAELLEQGKPLFRARIWDGSTPWIVTGHATQREILSDPRVSVNEKLPGFPYPSQAMAETVDHRPLTIFNADGADHVRIRRMMTAPFTRNRMEKLRPAIQQITDDLIDRMLAGPKPADLVTALSLPLPSLMICELLGVPYADHDFFQQHATVAVKREATAEESLAGMQALGGYLTQLLQTKMAEPGNDVLSDFAARVKAGELELPDATLLSMVLLIAGHETSANMITLGTAALLENPEQLALLRTTEDPAVTANAVEELLRYLTIPHLGQRRIALEDIEIAGETIRAGDGIIVSLPAGNWDSDAFPEPDRLDLTRAARHHHAFAWGAHQCLGQQLARIELQVVYGTLYRRVPTLRLAVGRDKLEFKGDSLAYGVYELPVTW